MPLAPDRTVWTFAHEVSWPDRSAELVANQQKVARLEVYDATPHPYLLTRLEIPIKSVATAKTLVRNANRKKAGGRTC